MATEKPASETKKRRSSQPKTKTGREILPRVAKQNTNKVAVEKDGVWVPVLRVSKVPKPSPKRKPRKPIVKNVKGRKTKPRYIDMIIKAIRDHKGRGPVSQAAISKYLAVNYPVPEGFKHYLRHSLRKGVEEGILERVRASYKLTTKANRKKKKSTKRKKSKKPTKKRATTKPAKKTKTTRTSPTKKRKRSASTDKKAAPTKKRKKQTTSKPRDEKRKKVPKASKKATTKKRGTPKKTRTKKKPASKGGASPKRKSPAKKNEPTVWHWQYYHNPSWYNYEPEASKVVEEVYQEYLKNPYATDIRDVKSGEWNYLVDFGQMQQTNVGHAARTVRDIRRLQLPESEAIFPSKAYD